MLIFFQERDFLFLLRNFSLLLTKDTVRRFFPPLAKEERISLTRSSEHPLSSLEEEVTW